MHNTDNIELELHTLNVADAYQRTVRPSRVRAMIQHFDANAVGSLCVGIRKDGTRWLVDGLQRREALLARGFTAWRCDVFESNGPSHEARVFRHKNKDRTQVNTLSLFKAALTEGDGDSVAINACVESAGFRINFSNSGSARVWPTISSVGALQNIFDRGGTRHLTAVLNLVADVWSGNNEAILGVILDGLSLFMSQSGVDNDRLKKKLRLISPTAVVQYADGNHKLMGGSRVKATANAFLNYYNKGLHKNRLEVIETRPA